MNASMKQRLKSEGFIVIFVLVFMLALGLLAATGMRSVMTAERIAANERDRLLAFEAAESAAAEAVARINQGGTSSNQLGIYAAMHTLGSYSSFWLTTSSLPVGPLCLLVNGDPHVLYQLTERFNWALCARTAEKNYGNLVKPQYVIENMASAVLANTSPLRTRYHYRITARATGGSDQAEVIVQSHYFKDLDCHVAQNTCDLYQDPGSHRKVWRQLQ
jgi:type IV pilus assembly protein PilX